MQHHHRESLFFEIYASAQPMSLRALVAQLRSVGIDVSVSTLKRYSTTYHWQQRLQERERTARAARDAEAVQHRRQHLTRSAQLGQGLQGLAATALRQLAGDQARLQQAFTPQHIARLAEAGTRIADGALQVEASYEAAVVQVVEVLVPGVVQLYNRAEQLEDGGERRREFALGLDRLVDQLLAEPEASR